MWRDGSGPVRKQLHVFSQLYLDLHLYVFHMSTYFDACIFSFHFSLFCKFLFVEMKSKLSIAPITTQFRLKLVCVQCSDEISTVSCFFCFFVLSLFLVYSLSVIQIRLDVKLLCTCCLYVCLFLPLYDCLFVFCLFVCAYWML